MTFRYTHALIASMLITLYVAPLAYVWNSLQRERFVLSSTAHGGTISVIDYGATGDGVTDDGAAFESAFAAAVKYNAPVTIPKRTYVENRTLHIESGMVIRSDGALLTHTNSAIPILSAISADAWVIDGPLTLSGTRTQANQHDSEIGLLVSGSSHFIVNMMTVEHFKGSGIAITDGKAAKIGNGRAQGRGNHGQFAFITFLDNTVGLEIGPGTGAEYNLLALTSFSSNDLATNIAGGNTIMSASNIVDNASGVQLSDGTNHGHGIFNAVQINHNQLFNINAVRQMNGYTFNACHIYGNSADSGQVRLTDSTGIHFQGGTLDSTFVNEGGGTNLVSDDFIAGSTFAVTGNNSARLQQSLLFDQNRVLDDKRK